MRQKAKQQVMVSGLNHSFGDGPSRKQVLFDNQLSIAAGELVVMTGPSGSGKTTLLTLIGALRTVQDGTLEVLGRDLGTLDDEQLVNFRTQLGFIFQLHNLFGSLTAIENVMLARDREPVEEKVKRRNASEILERLGLAERIDARPENLSGGQRQRVAVARALVAHPQLILADEPTAALDKDSSRTVVELLQERCRDDGTTVIMVTHDNRILDVADRIVNMVDGRIATDVAVNETLDLCELLSGSELFENLDPATMTLMAEALEREELPAGEAVFHQGDQGDRFYLIRSGEVEVEVVVDGDQAGEQIARLGDGGFFGEVALVTGDPRNATVRTLVPTVLYWLDKGTFLNVINSRDSLQERLRKVLFARQ